MLPLLRIAACAVSALVAACGRQAEPPTAAEPDAASIIAAERAFAADGYERGVKLSFLAFSADGAITFAPEPGDAKARLEAAPDLSPEDAATRPRLSWWPLYAGIARSGDLGFTTGPYAVGGERRGHYFTVWKKQPDGAWKWVLDAGVGADASGEAEQGAKPSLLALGAAGEGSADAAIAAVDAAEAVLARAAAANMQSAYEPFLDADSRLHSDGPPPAKTADLRAVNFDARPKAARFSRLGGGASAAGDLAWSYGEARWDENGAEMTGYYVRLWQMREGGWRIVFDEFLPPPAR